MKIKIKLFIINAFKNITLLRFNKEILFSFVNKIKIRNSIR